MLKNIRCRLEFLLPLNTVDIGHPGLNRQNTLCIGQPKGRNQLSIKYIMFVRYIGYRMFQG